MSEFKLDLAFYSSTPARVIMNVAPAAEREGFDTLWVGEYYFFRDVITILGYVAGATSKMKIATGTINIFTRHPALLAMTLATLDELSNGRCVLGLGYGGFPRMPLMGYELFPLAEKKPLRRFLATLDLVKRLLRLEQVKYNEGFVLNDVRLDFEPPRKEIPIYIFTEGPKTISISPKVADGVILSPGIKDRKTLETRVKNAQHSMQRYNNPNFEIGSFIYTLMSKDNKEAIEVMKTDIYFLYQLIEVIPATVGMRPLEEAGITQERFNKMLEAWRKFNIPEVVSLVPDEIVTDLTATGSPDECLEKISSLRKMGFSRVGINPSPKQDMNLLITSLSPRQHGLGKG